MKRKILFISLVICLWALLGCKKSGNNGTGPDNNSNPNNNLGPAVSGESAWRGIYQITHFSRNLNGCDEAGTDNRPISADGYFALFKQSFLGQQYLQIISCENETDCREKYLKMVSEQSGFFDFSFSLFYGTDALGYKSKIEKAGSNMEYVNGAWVENGCKGGREDLTLIKNTSSNELELESRYHEAFFEADAEGICWTDEGGAAAEGKPCSELTLLQGSFISGLD